MRLLKIKVNIDRVGGRTHYTYPQPHYNMLSIVFGPTYEGGMDKNLPDIWARGSKESSFEYILVGVKNNIMLEDALESSDIEEISEQECIDYGNQWTGQSDRILDTDKIVQILAKKARGESLSIQEEKALDPADSELGINRTKSFQESLNEIELDFPN